MIFSNHESGLNLRVNGQVRMKCLDSHTGQEKWSYRSKNQLTNWFEHYWLSDFQQLYLVGRLFHYKSAVSLSSYAGPPLPRSQKVKVKDLSKNVRWSNQPSGESSWTVDSNSRPRFIEKLIQFPSPGEGKGYEFQTVIFHPTYSPSIKDPDTGLTVAHPNSNVLAYAILESPCPQGDFDVLNLFYRFEISLSDGFDETIDPLREQALFELLVNGVGHGISTKRDFFSNPRGWHGVPLPDPTQYPYIYPNTASVFLNFSSNLNAEANEDYMYHQNQALIPEGDRIGKLLRCGHWGNINRQAQASWWQTNVDLSQLSQIQGVYSHQVGATAAFFDALQVATGTGKVIVGGDGNWTGTWPEAWEIIIEETGDVGTATYRFRKGVFGGWFNNQLDSCRFLGIPYINQGNVREINAFKRQYVDISGTCLAIDRERICTWRPENGGSYVGFNILNLSNGEYEIYDDQSTPAFNANHIYQISSNRKIVGFFNNVAATKLCIAADSGLFEFALDTKTFNQIRETKCVACDYGYQDKIIAILDNGGTPEIVKSSAPTTPLPLTESKVKDNTPLIYGLRVEKNSSEFNTAILVDRDIVWWNENQGGTLGPTGGIPASSPSNRIKYIQVSGVGSHWAVTANANYNSTTASSKLNNYLLTFNATTIEKFENTEHQPGGQCFWIGDKLWISGSVSGQSFPNFGGSLWNADRTNLSPAEAIYQSGKADNVRIYEQVFSYNTISSHASGSEICLYLDDGLVFFAFFGDLQENRLPSGILTSNYYAVRPLQDSRGSWMADYGWDGSEWVLGLTTSRETHATEKALLDGLTILFEDDEFYNSFVSSETWNFTVMNGFQQESKSDFSQALLYYVNPALGTDGSLVHEGTIPTSCQVYVPEAPSGSFPDTFWRNMLVYTERYFKAATIGTVRVVKVNLEGAPPEEGEITVYKDGRIEFNSADADAGKTFTVPYAYVRGN